jgi:hypothetical protein
MEGTKATNPPSPPPIGSEDSLSVVQDVDIEYSLTESFHQLLHIIQAAPDLAASTSMKARTGLS